MALFCDTIVCDFVFICASVLVAVYALFVHLQNRWTKKGIPFANLHPILGNLQEVILGKRIMSDVLQDFYTQHKSKPYIAFFSFTQPMVMINDLELIKTVLVKDFSSFVDRNAVASVKDPLEHYHLFTSKGQTWRNLRSKLTPTFTSGKMKRMFELIDTCGKNLISCFEKERGNGGDVLIKNYFARYTIDVIATSGFGIEGNALKEVNNTFTQMMRKSVTPDFIQRIIFTLMFVFPSVITKLNLVVTKPDVETYFRKLVWDTVEYRQKNKVKRNDFLGLLLQLKNKGKLDEDDPLDDGEVVQESNVDVDLEGDKFVSQCYLFLGAGFETSSSTMSYALYEMAINPEIQQRVYEEITTVLSKHDGKVTYESVQDMTYLNMVVHESLRKYPVLAYLDRKVTRPFQLPGTKIELAPGESVMIPVIGLHYDPDIYPEPQRFDPERFNEENRKTRPPCTFLGFGDGPRICIGMRLGLLQVKVGLVYSLLNYEFFPNTETPTALEFESAGPFNFLKGNLPLRMQKRNA